MRTPFFFERLQLPLQFSKLAHQLGHLAVQRVVFGLGSLELFVVGFLDGNALVFVEVKLAVEVLELSLVLLALSKQLPSCRTECVPRSQRWFS